MDDSAKSLARALAVVHGTGALNVAERALENVRVLKMLESVEEWERVIVALKAMKGKK